MKQKLGLIKKCSDKFAFYHEAQWRWEDEISLRGFLLKTFNIILSINEVDSVTCDFVKSF
jgi:hypothetical protein